MYLDYWFVWPHYILRGRQKPSPKASLKLGITEKCFGRRGMKGIEILKQVWNNLRTFNVIHVSKRDIGGFLLSEGSLQSARVWVKPERKWVNLETIGPVGSSKACFRTLGLDSLRLGVTAFSMPGK